MMKLKDLFNISNGNKLDKNKMEIGSINFVNRSRKNNGITARVAEIDDVKPYSGGCISVALGGSVLASFLQPDRFYTGQNVAVLSPKFILTDSEKLYYCTSIQANAYRFTACGREANRFLADLDIPSIHEIPNWVKGAKIYLPTSIKNPIINDNAIEILDTKNWKFFSYSELFIIKNGGNLTKNQTKMGKTPYITSTGFNNGLTDKIEKRAITTHTGNTISVSSNGSVGEAFYQPKDFYATGDVNVLYPKFSNNPTISLFLCTLIRQEKYRYNYGRKWTLAKMKSSFIKLPVLINGDPDWNFMQNYILSIPYSGTLVC